MTLNDILRQIRYTFDYKDPKMIELFGLGGLSVKHTQIIDWLRKEDDPSYQLLPDKELAVFLNGFIIEKRGKKEGPEPVPENSLNNNIIFRKLKIALDLKDEDIVQILDLVDFRMSKHEINAFFRNPSQNQYRNCLDQVLRNFLHGMQLRYRDGKDETRTP
jgi:uncharacterized protein YehS (DUF1456 family)